MSKELWNTADLWGFHVFMPENDSCLLDILDLLFEEVPLSFLYTHASVEALQKLIPAGIILGEKHRVGASQSPSGSRLSQFPPERCPWSCVVQNTPDSGSASPEEQQQLLTPLLTAC